jgi:D-amino peptidase
MHVAVFADLEGSFGIWRQRQCHSGTAEWQYGRFCLTADVNAVIKGAFEGGADKVTVKDTHDSGFNCLVRRLEPRVLYVGGHFIRPSLFGRVSDYDLILYVAIHAAAGTPNAFFPHTHLGIFSEVKVNDRIVCEMDIYGGYLGEFGVPIGFVSGEDVAVEQALHALPWAKSVRVDKRRETYIAGEKSKAFLALGRKKLQETAADAVRGASFMKPLKPPGPFHFEATFRDEKLAKRYNTWGFRQIGRVVEWDGEDMIEGFDKLNKLAFFRKKYYAFRGPMIFLMRNFFRLKHMYFAPAPNAQGAELSI